MKVELGPLPPPVMRPFVIGDVYDADQMRAYAQQEVAKERERCAKLCETLNPCGRGDCAELAEIMRKGTE